MRRLADLFTTTGALSDTNGDGYADGIALRIVAPGAPTAWEWCALADVAAVLGLHVTGFSLPLVVDAWDGPTLLLDPADDAALPAGTGNATVDGATLAVRGGDAAGRAAMLRALARGALPEATEWRVTEAQYPPPAPQPIATDPDAPSTDGAIVVADLFMANGNPGALSLFVDGDGDRLPDDTRCCIVVPENISREIGSAIVDVAARIGVETAGLTVPLCAPVDLGAAMPIVVGDAAPVAVRGDRPLPYRRDDGRIGIAIAGATEDATRRILHMLATAPLVDTAFPRFPEPAPMATPLWTWAWDAPRERDAVMGIVRDRLPHLGTEPCDLLVQVSEDATEHAAIRAALRAMLPSGSTVTVLPVYHAGRAWLEEVVAPAARECEHLAALEVTCRALVPREGDAALDLPIRWLQECWPADEIIAPLLGLPREQVRITLGAADQPEIFQARALDAAGNTLAVWTFSPHWNTRPYLPDFPAQGNIHVTTGGVTIRRAGAVIFDTSLPTDLDRFWDAWQTQALPKLRAHILAIHDGRPTATDQPFFDELRVEVWASEPEYALGVREERESPAEGLAEDIYFNTLDYLHTLGEQIAGAPWDEPGQIVPLVHVTPGEAPHATVRLLRHARGAMDGARPVAARETGVAMDEVVTNENLPGLLAHAAHLPGVTIRDVGRSYQGRTMAVIEVVKPDDAAVRSRAKLAAMKPTHLIVARHHANEVASTTAALRLVELLATDAATAPLLDRCNVIVIPNENPDGTALHALLMAEHPTWKHHAARYNAVGVEFGMHGADPATLYGEARVRPLLTRQWRPDVITDNHGVPSHEWWQPFAGGGNPPRFRISYWLCQALIYGICRYAPDPPHAAFAEALWNAVSDAVAADPDLAAANRVYAERYAHWGHQYVPEQFPATYHGAMLWFFNAAEATPEVPSREIALREARMLSAHWITEVLDETARGAHLALVAHAHLTANRAVLRLMAENAPPVAFSATPLPNGRVHHRLHRMRPLPASNDRDMQ